MADAKPINSGEEATNAPTGQLGLDSGAQFRTLSKRLDEVADQVSRLQPNRFRLADIIQMGMIVVALIIAVLTALGLKDRVDDLVKAQAATETRLSSQLSASEIRLGGRIDRVDEQVGKLRERTAEMEGSSRRR